MYNPGTQPTITAGMRVTGSDAQDIGRVARVERPAFDDEAMRDDTTDLGVTNIDTDTGPAETEAVPMTPLAPYTEKGRGEPTNAGLAAHPMSRLLQEDAAQAGTPGAQGRDALRGYGMPADQSDPLVGALPGSDGGSLDAAGEGAQGTVGRDGGTLLVQTAGVLGVGAAVLRIPFEAIKRVSPDGEVTLSCTRLECEARYGRGPSLQIDPNADILPG